MQDVPIKSKDDSGLYDKVTPKKSSDSQTPERPKRLVIECVGEHPLRMLVILVKLIKSVDYKSKIVQELTELNDEAESLGITETCPDEFKERYSTILHRLEHANKLVNAYLDSMDEYSTGFLEQKLQ